MVMTTIGRINALLVIFVVVVGLVHGGVGGGGGEEHVATMYGIRHRRVPANPPSRNMGMGINDWNVQGKDNGGKKEYTGKTGFGGHDEGKSDGGKKESGKRDVDGKPTNESYGTIDGGKRGQADEGGKGGGSGGGNNNGNGGGSIGDKCETPVPELEDEESISNDPKDVIGHHGGLPVLQSYQIQDRYRPEDVEVHNEPVLNRVGYPEIGETFVWTQQDESLKRPALALSSDVNGV